MSKEIKQSGIYAFFNITNGKCYVGSAVKLTNRCRGHVVKLRNGTHQNNHFQSAWTKYGETSFVWVVLEIVDDKSKLIEREKEWISSFSEVYNKSTAGSAFGIKHTDERRKKASEKMKEKWSDPEFRKSITEKIQKAMLDPEERERRSKSRKLQWTDPVYRSKVLAGQTGRKASEEARKNMSLAQKKRHEDPEQLSKLKQNGVIGSRKRWEKI